MILNDCATGTLAPYAPSPTQPWNEQRVLHLLRRTGFSGKKSEVTSALSKSPAEVVDALIDAAVGADPIPAPDWGYWTEKDYDFDNFDAQVDAHFVEWLTKMGYDMVNNSLRAKLVLFWHNHFVTRYESYNCTAYLYQYYHLLETHALGNFRTFIEEMSKEPAMLYFLNGLENTRFSPNENYARELYELFSLGADNGYTQQDIVETARALTGWVDIREFCGEIKFSGFFWDQDNKTIFGQTGPWGFADVHRILFEERAAQISIFICRKLYKQFVGHRVDEDIVAGMAETFRNNDFELEPVLRQLFKSEHFFDEAVMGTQIKAPIETTMNFLKEVAFEQTDEIVLNLVYFAYLLGQEIFNPVDVAGWQGNRSWIDTNTLTGRWKGLQGALFYVFQNEPERLRDFATELTGGFTNDPEFVTQVIIDHLIPKGLPDQVDYDRATIVFKGDIPQNYYDDGLWNTTWDTVPGQVTILLEYLVRRPEFQLV